jgi:hypothetical protein
MGWLSHELHVETEVRRAPAPRDVQSMNRGTNDENGRRCALPEPGEIGVVLVSRSGPLARLL